MPFKNRPSRTRHSVRATCVHSIAPPSGAPLNACAPPHPNDRQNHPKEKQTERPDKTSEIKFSPLFVTHSATTLSEDSTMPSEVGSKLSLRKALCLTLMRDTTPRLHHRKKQGISRFIRLSTYPRQNKLHDEINTNSTTSLRKDAWARHLADRQNSALHMRTELESA